MASPTVTIEGDGRRTVAALAGDLVIAHVDRLGQELGRVAPPPGQALVLDLAGVGALDTAGAWLLVGLRRRLAAEGVAVEIVGLSPPHAGLMRTVEANLPPAPPPDRARKGLADWLADVGEGAAAAAGAARDLFGLLGVVLVRIAGLVLRPWRLRLTSLVHHMEETGLKAVPIVALMAFLIGVVLAFQGASQLRQFGAEIFVVDLIAISLLRELGILLTAIVVAGRTASAFTAAIGSMKMREEIDALKTLGVDPVEVLVVPRFLALIVMLPILGFIANVAGLVGGAAMSWIELGVSPGSFQARLLDGTDVRHFLVGMVKAPFFAAIIALIGCHQGLRVEGNAESLGRLTSQSVVLAIFTVIVVDALFSVFFALIDV